jgi:hypothetical protein
MSIHVLDEMPAWVEARHAELNRAARESYALRNAAEHYGDEARAMDLHETGDVYFGWSLAITAEWES